MPIRRTTAAAVIAALAAGCGGGGSSAAPPAGQPSPTLPLSPAVPSITALDNTSPTSLTALHISTKNINPSAPVTVTFTTAAGGSTPLQAFRIGSDGTVVVAVPQYLDPTTGSTVSTSATVTISQNKVTSVAVPLTIQDMPQISDYGTAPGQITRTLLNYETMALSGELGVSRGLASIPANSVNTAQQTSDVASLLASTIKSRNDLDRVQATGTAIAAGTLPDGTAVSFDKNSIAQMDRVLGVLLLQLAPGLTNGAVTSTSVRSALSASTAPAPGTAAYQGRPLRGVMSVRYPKTLTASVLQKTLAAISSGSFGLPTAALGLGLAVNSPTHPLGDGIVSVLQGISSLSYLVAIGTGPTPVGVGAELLAVGCSLGATAVSGYLAYTDYQGAADAAAKGNLALATQLSNSYNNELSNTIMGGIGTIFGGLTAGGAADIGGSEISSIPAVYKLLTTDGAQNILQAGNLAFSAYGLFNNAKQAQADSQTASRAAAEIGSSSTPMFAQATGTAKITNSEGVYGPLPALTLESGSTPISNAAADMTGAYLLDVPLGAPVPYNGLTLLDYDPLTTSVVSSTTVNLNGLTPGTTSVLPTLTGTCNDPDAYSGDGDDPDCD